MYLLRHHCMWPDCDKPVLGDWTGCGHCDRVLCTEHHGPPLHQCMILEHARAAGKKARKAYWTKLIPMLQELDLAQEAAELRPGHTCSVRLPDTWQQARKVGLGSMMNSLFFVTFDDGVRWLVRIRERKPWSPTPEVQRVIDESEVATMQVLKNAGLPVPGAWMPPRAKEAAEKQGIFYFFTEFCEGNQFKAFSSPLVPKHTTQEELERLMLEYAKFQIKLSDVTFDAIGCVMPPGKAGQTYSMGPYLDFCQPDPPCLLGPYKTQRERYCSQIDTLLDCVVKGELFSSATLFAALGYIHVRRIVCELPVFREHETKFYIKHADDKGDIFFISDKGLEGIIDWEWAFTTTAAEAFSSPRFCYTSEAYRNGINTLSPEEELLIATYEKLGRDDLAGFVRSGRMYNRLWEILQGYMCTQNLNGLSVAAGMCFAETVPASHDLWVEWALEEYKNVEVIRELTGKA